jgi:hypothetical protein
MLAYLNMFDMKLPLMRSSNTYLTRWLGRPEPPFPERSGPGSRSPVVMGGNCVVGDHTRGASSSRSPNKSTPTTNLVHHGSKDNLGRNGPPWLVKARCLRKIERPAWWHHERRRTKRYGLECGFCRGLEVGCHGLPDFRVANVEQLVLL